MLLKALKPKGKLLMSSNRMIPAQSSRFDLAISSVDRQVLGRLDFLISAASRRC